MEKDKTLEQGFKILFLGLQLANPKIKKEEAEKIIVNIGNYLQLKELTKTKK